MLLKQLYLYIKLFPTFAMHVNHLQWIAIHAFPLPKMLFLLQKFVEFPFKLLNYIPKLYSLTYDHFVLDLPCNSTHVGFNSAGLSCSDAAPRFFGLIANFVTIH